MIPRGLPQAVPKTERKARSGPEITQGGHKPCSTSIPTRSSSLYEKKAPDHLLALFFLYLYPEDTQSKVLPPSTPGLKGKKRRRILLKSHLGSPPCSDWCTRHGLIIPSMPSPSAVIGCIISARVPAQIHRHYSDSSACKQSCECAREAKITCLARAQSKPVCPKQKLSTRIAGGIREILWRLSFASAAYRSFSGSGLSLNPVFLFSFFFLCLSAFMPF